MDRQQWAVMNPEGDVDIEGRGGATRLDDFSGKRVGFWWNGKPSGDIFLNELARQFESRCQGMTPVRMWEINPATMTAYGVCADNLDFMVKNADVVIGALAD